MSTLSERREQVYQFIVGFKKSHDGNSPTITEIGKACGIKSPSHVSWILRRTEAVGMIRCNYDGGKPRMIEVVGGRWLPPQRLR